MKALINKCTIFANEPTNITFNENHTIFNTIAHYHNNQATELQQHIPERY